MTAQISDSFIFNGEDFSLTGFTDKIPFYPGDYAITPKGVSSACWRGFYRIFSIVNNELVLKKFNVNDANIENNISGPKINGVKPNLNTKGRSFFNKSYENIDLKIAYTGSILIGKGFIRDLYVHMGFHPAWKFKKVFELTFDKGNLIETIDLSEKMVEVRKEVEKKKTIKNNEIEVNEIAKWIKESFNQKYIKRL